MKDVKANRINIGRSTAADLAAVLFSMLLFIAVMTVSSYAYEDWEELKSLINDAENGETIVLEDDYWADKPGFLDTVRPGDELRIGSGKNITIDLNGHTIDRILYDTFKDDDFVDIDSDVEGVFHVEGQLTIKDSKGGGVIKGGYPVMAYLDGNDVKLKEAGGAFTVDGGTLNIEGGTIRDCYATAGAIWLTNRAKLNLDGGTITGTESYSGTVVVNGDSTFNMSGGSIDGNNIEATAIKGFDPGNTAVYVKQGSFNMSGGSIRNNSGNMTQGNSSDVTSCAVRLGDNGTFSVSGAPYIENNGLYDDSGRLQQKRNVYLASGQKINVTGGLTDDAHIGVLMEEPGVFTASADSVKASDYAQCFSTDNGEVEVLASGDELKMGNFVRISSMRFRSTRKTINVGGSYNIEMSIDPRDASNQKLDWTSSDETVLSVSDSGTVKGLKEGKASITVKTTDGSNLSRSRVITVTHNLTKTEKKEATCTEAGNIEYWTCSCCGKHFKDENGNTETSSEDVTIEALGHDWNDWEIAEDGSMTRTCSRCTKTESVEKHDHDCSFIDEQNAGCTTSGHSSYYKCSVCNSLFKDAEGKQPTTEAAVRIPATGHTAGEPENGEETHATCSSVGGYKQTTRCEKCGAVLKETKIVTEGMDSNKHDWDQPEYTWSEDYKTVTAKRICLNDEAQHGETQDHPEEETVDVEKSEIAATCEDSGKIIYTAEFENRNFETQTYTQITDPPLGHNWDNGVMNDEPTCTKTGKMTFTCTTDPDNPHTMTVELARLPHKWEKKEKTKEPTCTEAGKMTLTCTRDADNPHTEIVDIPALGHDWDEWKVVKAATENEDGLEERVCKNDKSHKETRAIPKFGTKTVSIKNAKVVLSASSFTYNGKVRKPSIKTVGGKALKSGTDYTVTWSNKSSKNVGSYTVTITGKGNYEGSTKATYKINPKGTNLKKPKKAKKAVTVKWKKQSAKMAKSRITGYQIQLATDKKFTKNKKTVNVKGYKKVSKKVKKLKAKKKYYIRIRTYKTISGKKYYSGWSKVKTAKTR